jgi:hypothetical protein
MPSITIVDAAGALTTAGATAGRAPAGTSILSRDVGPAIAIFYQAPGGGAGG